MNKNNLFDSSRREFLITLTAVCGSLLSPSVLAGDFASLSRNKGGTIKAGKILSLAQMKALAAISDIIIPKTDTASASEVDVHGVIDNELAFCSDRADAAKFINQLDRFCILTKADTNKPFEALNQNKRLKCTEALAKGSTPYKDVDKQFFIQLKALIVMAYYTSEEGASKALVYDPIPGGYKGDFKVSDNQGKAFSIFHY